MMYPFREVCALARVWGIIRIREKIASDWVAEMAEPDLDGALEALCRALDVPRPVVLRKHRQEFARFFRTRFLPGDFMETVGFAAFEVELLRDKRKKDANTGSSGFGV